MITIWRKVAVLKDVEIIDYLGTPSNPEGTV